MLDVSTSHSLPLVGTGKGTVQRAKNPMTRIIYFDHVTTFTTPLPKLSLMKRMSYYYKVIYLVQY